MATMLFTHRPTAVAWQSVILKALGPKAQENHPMDNSQRVGLQDVCTEMERLSKVLFDASELKKAIPETIRESARCYTELLSGLQNHHFPSGSVAANRVRLPDALFGKQVIGIETLEEEAALATRNAILVYFNSTLQKLVEVRTGRCVSSALGLKDAVSLLSAASQIATVFDHNFVGGAAQGRSAHPSAGAATAEEAMAAKGDAEAEASQGLTLFSVARGTVDFTAILVKYQRAVSGETTKGMSDTQKHSILSRYAYEGARYPLPVHCPKEVREIRLIMYALSQYHLAEKVSHAAQPPDMKTALSYSNWSMETLAKSKNHGRLPDEVPVPKAADGSNDSKEFLRKFEHSTIVGLIPQWEVLRNDMLLSADRMHKENNLVYHTRPVKSHHLEEPSGVSASETSRHSTASVGGRTSVGGQASLGDRFRCLLPTAESIAKMDHAQKIEDLERKELTQKIQSATARAKEQLKHIEASQPKIPMLASGAVDHLLDAVKQLETAASQAQRDALGGEENQFQLSNGAGVFQNHGPSASLATAELVSSLIHQVDTVVQQQEHFLSKEVEAIQCRYSTLTQGCSSAETHSALKLTGLTTARTNLAGAASSIQEKLVQLGSAATSGHHRRVFDDALRKAIALDALSPDGSLGGLLEDNGKLSKQYAPHLQQAAALQAQPSLEQLKATLQSLNQLNAEEAPVVLNRNKTFPASALLAEARNFAQVCNSVKSVLEQGMTVLQMMRHVTSDCEEESEMSLAMQNHQNETWVGVLEPGTPMPSMEPEAAPAKKGKAGKGKKHTPAKKGKAAAKKPSPKPTRASKRTLQAREDEEAADAALREGTGLVLGEDGAPVPSPSAVPLRSASKKEEDAGPRWGWGLPLPGTSSSDPIPALTVEPPEDDGDREPAISRPVQEGSGFLGTATRAIRAWLGPTLVEDYECPTPEYPPKKRQRRE